MLSHLLGFLALLGASLLAAPRPGRRRLRAGAREPAPGRAGPCSVPPASRCSTSSPTTIFAFLTPRRVLPIGQETRLLRIRLPPARLRAGERDGRQSGRRDRAVAERREAGAGVPPVSPVSPGRGPRRGRGAGIRLSGIRRAPRGRPVVRRLGLLQRAGHRVPVLPQGHLSRPRSTPSCLGPANSRAQGKTTLGLGDTPHEHRTGRALALLAVAAALGVAGETLRVWVPARLDVTLWGVARSSPPSADPRWRAHRAAPGGVAGRRGGGRLSLSALAGFSDALRASTFWPSVGLLVLAAPATAMRSLDRLGVSDLIRGGIWTGVSVLGGPIPSVLSDIRWAELPLTARTRRLTAVAAGSRRGGAGALPLRLPAERGGSALRPDHGEDPDDRSPGSSRSMSS